MKLHDLYLDIESVGLKVDFTTKKVLDDKYSKRLEETNNELWELCEEKINPNSSIQVAKLLFETFGCPRRKDTKDDTLTALKLNVLSKSSKWEKANKCIDLTLDSRKIRKTLNTYVRAEADPDGRMRTQYHLNKETGRTSTKILDSPIRHRKFGLPFHNITKHSDIGRDVRSMFVPDKDCYFLEADQEQAEARIVMLLSEEYDTLQLFDLIDIHCLTASWIYNCEWTDIKKLEKTDENEYEKKRQLGKKCRHAGGYGQTKYGLSKTANIKINKAERILNIFHKFTPGIRNKFHEDIKNELINNDLCLYTPFGRFRKFYDRWGDALLREALAHIPQSTIGDNTKRAMLEVKKEHPDLMICIESHDGFTSIVREREAEEVARLIKSKMELPIDFSKGSLKRRNIIIPCEFKIGKNNLEKMEKFII